MMGHIDVVDAKREDWERDPFTLFEENGFFYGRGTADESMAGRLARPDDPSEAGKGFQTEARPRDGADVRRGTSNRVNGVDYLLKNQRDLFDAAFAINEGAGGLLSETASRGAASAGGREDSPGVYAGGH